MASPYLGTILYFGGNFTIRGYQMCNGQLLPINQNTALFSLLGTTYGGNGSSTFGLPDLRGRAPLHMGQRTGGPAYTLGQNGGSEATTLTQSQLPPHTHTVAVTGTVNAGTAKGIDSTPAAGYQLTRAVDGSPNGTAVPFIYGPTGGTTVALAGVNVAGTAGITGNGLPIPTLSPYLTLNALIAIQGIFPSRN